jgi:DNA-binding transcriptional MerR regulator
VPDDELMPIGAFAQRTGLTPSALRFYADSGLLPPAEVDPASGYRYYAAGQVARATVLRRLRELAMPLADVGAALDAGADEATRILDGHVAQVLAHAADVQRRAAALRPALGGAPGEPIAALKGPVLADAVDQVLTAAVHDPLLPALAGVRVEASPEAVALTATDRYRLSTRTLVPVGAPGRAWAGTVDGGELRDAVADIRRSALVRVDAVPHAVRFRADGRADRWCRLLTGEFPDHRRMLASLGEATTRAVVAKDAFLRALEEHPGEHVALRVTGGGVAVRPADGGPGTPLPATATGADLLIRFALTTLYPAVSTAVGPDVLLDLRGADRPVTVRSADRGDLTTLAMPVMADPAA